MTVAIISTLYGEHHRRFVKRWAEAVEALCPAADQVIVGTDGGYDVPGARMVESYCHWRHPQAWYQQSAIAVADTDWVWLLDIDDIAFPDALMGLEDVAADVWQVGFERSDGERYRPPALTAAEFLASSRNVYVGTSMIRTDIFREVGGFSDVALQDWALWRRLARHGAVVEVSPRIHFGYMRHPRSRGATELTLDVRDDHLAEMMEAELARA